MSGLVPFNRNRNVGNFYSMLDDFFNDAWSPRRSVQSDTFKLDVKEDDQEYVVEAELPGVNKDELNVELREGRLTIAVNRDERKAETDEQKQVIHRERYYTSMARSLFLGDAAREGIDAKLSDGILSIHVPKAPSNEPNYRIDIN